MRIRQSWIPAFATLALLTPAGCEDPLADGAPPRDSLETEEPPEVDLDEGTLSDQEAPALAVGPLYPPRNIYQIKGISPDFWGHEQPGLNPAPGRTRNDLIGHATGRVALNMYWHEWQPVQRPVDSNGQCLNVPGSLQHSQEAARRTLSGWRTTRAASGSIRRSTGKSARTQRPAWW